MEKAKNALNEAEQIIREDPATRSTIQNIRNSVEESAMVVVLGQPQVGKTSCVRQAFPDATFTHADKARQLLDDPSPVVIIDEMQTIKEHIWDHLNLIRKLLKRKKIIATALTLAFETPDRAEFRHYLEDSSTTFITKPYFPDRLVKRVAETYPLPNPAMVPQITSLLGGQIHCLLSSCQEPENKSSGIRLNRYQLKQQAMKSLMFMPEEWIEQLWNLAQNGSDEPQNNIQLQKLAKYGLVKFYGKGQVQIRSTFLKLLICGFKNPKLLHYSANTPSHAFGFWLPRKVDELINSAQNQPGFSLIGDREDPAV